MHFGSHSHVTTIAWPAHNSNTLFVIHCQIKGYDNLASHNLTHTLGTLNVTSLCYGRFIRQKCNYLGGTESYRPRTSSRRVTGCHTSCQIARSSSIPMPILICMLSRVYHNFAWGLNLQMIGRDVTDNLCHGGNSDKLRLKVAPYCVCFTNNSFENYDFKKKNV